jgi:phage tail sheath protein FI
LGAAPDSTGGLRSTVDFGSVEETFQLPGPANNVTSNLVVFEQNGEPLRSEVRRCIEHFLAGLWRAGALPGAQPRGAYFVRCDRSTMTQADIDAGRLVVEIGVAAVKPAEFTIFRIGQKTADAG